VRGTPAEYTCPGESHPISRSVHYARMAAFFPGCRQCIHRHDTGHLPQSLVRTVERTGHRHEPHSLIGPAGVRGVYLNQMTRSVAERFASGFAACLWGQSPLRLNTAAGGVNGAQRRRPLVVVGHDDRPAAPDLVVGVATALRRMGCAVVDVGMVSTPAFWCAVEHLEAAGGIHVTGQGCGPSGIGLDFVEAGGVPWSPGGSLERLEAALTSESRRTSRRGGTQRSFRIGVPYAAGLLKHYQSLRAMRIGLVCLAPTVEPSLTELFASLPCRPERVAAPVANDPDRAFALALNRLAERIRDDRLSGGFLIADDGQCCRLLDERGAVVETAVLAERLSDFAAVESKARTAVLDSALDPELSNRLARRNWSIVANFGTREAMSRGLRETGAAFGCDASGRFWFGDASPRCDALTTLGRVLQLLSRSDAPVSALRELAETPRSG